MFITGLHFQS